MVSPWNHLPIPAFHPESLAAVATGLSTPLPRGNSQPSQTPQNPTTEDSLMSHGTKETAQKKPLLIFRDNLMIPEHVAQATLHRQPQIGRNLLFFLTDIMSESLSPQDAPRRGDI